MESLHQAWRALAGNDGEKGWRTIPIRLEAPSRLLAGRHWPDDEEAIIVGFNGIRSAPDSHLPQGSGFRVVKLRGSVPDSSLSWLALCRKAAGNLDLFTMMACDVAGLLESCSDVSEERRFRLFLSRVRAWQYFMEQGRDGVLSQEAEIGLFGELIVLRSLLSVGMPAVAALDAWQGPAGSMQDFLIGPGAIEVKTTLSARSFPATVNSLEQLDETLRQPLFVAGVRLVLGNGQTLPECAGESRRVLQHEPVALAMFESRLVQAGYLEGLADQYVRRFLHSRTMILPVEGEFPRLTRMNVGRGITKARYEVDLDPVTAEDIGLTNALGQLGGI